MKRMIIVSAWLALAAVACDDGSKPTATPGASATSGSAAIDQEMTDAQLEAAPIAVEADFEEVAQTAITSDTLDDQVAALEKEINADAVN